MMQAFYVGQYVDVSMWDSIWMYVGQYVDVNSVTVCGCNCVGQYGCMWDSMWMYVGQYMDIYGTACGCKYV